MHSFDFYPYLQDTVSVFWYADSSQGDDPFLLWATAMAEEEDPPRSNSISWAAYEYVRCVFVYDLLSFGVCVWCESFVCVSYVSCYLF